MVGLRFLVFVINCHMVSSVSRVPVCSTGGQARIQGRWNGWIFTPLYLSPLLSFLFSYPLNIEIIFDFPDIITKIHPPFQNPGSALASKTGEHLSDIQSKIFKYSHVAKNIWEIITLYTPFGAKIFSDVRPWTLSVLQNSQFLSSSVNGKQFASPNRWCPKTNIREYFHVNWRLLFISFLLR